MTSGFDKFNKPVGFGQGLTPYLDQPKPTAPPVQPQGPMSPVPPPQSAPGMLPPPGPVADYPGDDLRARRFRPLAASLGTGNQGYSALQRAIGDGDPSPLGSVVPSEEDILLRLLDRLNLQGNG